MSVHFVYRAHYAGPSEKYVRTFAADTSVLGWFQSRWHKLSAGVDPYESTEEELGVKLYGFNTIFAAIEEHNLPVPQSVEQLRGYLEAHLYVEGEILLEDHCLQVLTDDDELDLAYYFFDDEYMSTHGDRAAFLLHADWKLPAGAVEGEVNDDEPENEGEFSLDFADDEPQPHELAPAANGEGTVYAAFLAFYCSGQLQDLPVAFTLHGLRLPQFTGRLVEQNEMSKWPAELNILRSVLTGPNDTLPEALQRVSALPLVDLGGSAGAIGNGTLKQASVALASALKSCQKSVSDSQGGSLFQHTAHLSQASILTETWNDPIYHQWIFFDDLWATANPELARGLLRFACRWDVLTVGEGESE